MKNKRDVTLICFIVNHYLDQYGSSMFNITPGTIYVKGILYQGINPQNYAMSIVPELVRYMTELGSYSFDIEVDSNLEYNLIHHRKCLCNEEYTN